jgi:hypothetical protein
MAKRKISFGDKLSIVYRKNPSIINPVEGFFYGQIVLRKRLKYITFAQNLKKQQNFK